MDEPLLTGHWQLHTIHYNVATFVQSMTDVGCGSWKPMMLRYKSQRWHLRHAVLVSRMSQTWGGGGGEVGGGGGQGAGCGGERVCMGQTRVGIWHTGLTNISF